MSDHKINGTTNLNRWANKIGNTTTEEVTGWVKDMMDQLEKFEKPERLARALKGIDEQIDRNENISCKAGCGACCHQLINISDIEADHISEAVKDGSITVKIDMERLAKQAKWEREDYYNNIPEARCVFLNEENSCGIYKHRPAVCRNYTVISDPKYCHTKYRHTHPKSVALTNPSAEIITSALWSLDGNNVEPMPKKLSDRLGK